MRRREGRRRALLAFVAVGMLGGPIVAGAVAPSAAGAEGDTTAPAVSCDPADPTWQQVQVQVSCTASDAGGSGLVGPSSFWLATQVPAGSADADASTESRSVCDGAGNCSTAVSTGHRVDLADPSVAADPAAFGTFVRGAVVPLDFACDDVGSGIATCDGRVGESTYLPGEELFTGGAYTATLDLTATDQALRSTHRSVPVAVTDVALSGTVTTASTVPPGWTQVSLWEPGASEASWWTTVEADGTYRFLVHGIPAGDYQVQFTAPDHLDAWFGGADRAHATLVPFGTRPQVADAHLELHDPDAPWVQCNDPASTTVPVDHEVVVACTAWDGVGLAHPADASFSLTTTVGADGERADASTGQRQVCDVAGNCLAVGPFGPYAVDRRAPTIALASPAEGAKLDLGSTLTVAPTCADLHLLSCSWDLGPATLLSTPGPRSFTVTARDRAGHTTTLVRTFEVVTTTLRGVVRNATTGQPVAGARVVVWNAAQPMTSTPQGQLTTAADGSWSLDGLRPATPYFAYYEAGGYASSWHGGAGTRETSTPLAGPHPATPVFVATLVPQVDVPAYTCTPQADGGTWQRSQADVWCSRPTGLPPGLPDGLPFPNAFLLSTSVADGTETASAYTGHQTICAPTGSCATYGPFGPFRVDRKAPVSTCQPSSSAWSATERVIPCTDVDGGSGVTSSGHVQQTGVGAGNWSATASTSSEVCDRLGNCRINVISGLKVDRAGPELTSCGTPAPTWTRVNQTVTCSAADPGSGLAGTAPTPFTTTVAAGQDGGVLSVSATRCDLVGNCTLRTITGFKVDRSVPTATCTAPPSTWVAFNVTLSCTAADGGSGLAAPFATNPVVPLSTVVSVGQESASAPTSSPTLCDLAGNCGPKQVTGIKVDRKAPVVTCTPPDGAWHATDVTGTCHQAEGGSGLPPKLNPGFPFFLEVDNLVDFSFTASVAAGEESASAPAYAYGFTSQRCDNLGNCTTLSFPGHRVDKKAPVVTVAAPAQAATVRDGVDLVAGYSCTDLSLVSCSGTVPSGQPLPGGLGVHEWSVTGTDAVGRTTTVTRSYTVVEGVAPTVTCAPPAGPGAWRTTQVTVSCTAVDPSGLGTPDQASFTLATAVAAGQESASAMTAAVEVCDVYGNCATAGPFGPYRVDRAGPSLDCTPAPTSWVKLNVTITCAPSDGGAGYTGAATVKGSSALPLGQESASVAISVKACDVLGTCTTRAFDGIKIDRKGPSVSCAAADGAWHAANVSLPCTQSDTGSGLTATSPSGGAATFAASTTLAAGRESATATATASASKSCDLAGNCVGVEVAGNKIDRRAPSASCPPRDDRWHTDNVSVTCTLVENGSGVPSPTVTSATSVADGTESARAPMSRTTVCDGVGNCTSVAAPGPYRVDRKAPRLSVLAPTDGAQLVTGTPMAVSYACADSGSGVASCSAPLASGAPLPTDLVGTFSLTVTATDVAGNETTTTVSWTVAPPLAGRIVDDVTGAPIAGATVQRFPAEGDGPALDSTSTDADGRYRFDGGGVVAAKLQVTEPGHLARWYGGSLRSSAKVLTTGGTKPLVADLRLVPAASIGGTISSTGGGAVAGATVVLYGTTSLPLAQTTADIDGRWRFTGLVAGTYKVQFTAPGHVPEWHRNTTSRTTATPIVAPLGATIDVGDDDLVALP